MPLLFAYVIIRFSHGMAQVAKDPKPIHTQQRLINQTRKYEGLSCSNLGHPSKFLSLPDIYHLNNFLKVKNPRYVVLCSMFKC